MTCMDRKSIFVYCQAPFVKHQLTKSVFYARHRTKGCPTPQGLDPSADLCCPGKVCRGFPKSWGWERLAKKKERGTMIQRFERKILVQKETSWKIFLMGLWNLVLLGVFYFYLFDVFRSPPEDSGVKISWVVLWRA